MARPLRLEFPGGVHHIYTRGNERRLIFLDDHDRRRLLSLLADAVDEFRWILTAHVLMPNHFHLVVELTRTTLSTGMKWLDGCYTQYFNRRHNRVGHLFQGRFKSPLIDKESYLLEVLRYVVLNPVRAGMVAHPADYPWSSYRATAGLDAVPPWLASGDVLAQFGSDRQAAQARYCRFVEEGIGSEKRPWDDLVGQMYLGSESWLRQMREKVERKPRDSEHPQAQRMPGTPAMAQIVTSVARVLSIDEERVRRGRRTMPRMLAAWIGRHEGFLTLASVAAGLRLRSSANVTAMVRDFEEQLRVDPAVQRALRGCLEDLRGVARSVEMKT